MSDDALMIDWFCPELDDNQHKYCKSNQVTHNLKTPTYRDLTAGDYLKLLQTVA